MKTRFIEPIKKNVVLISLLKGCDCECGRADKIVEVREIDDESPNPSMASFDENDWPTVCEKCGVDAGREGVTRSLSTRIVFNTDSGKPEPGDVFYRDYTAGLGNGCVYHDKKDGCSGRHIYAVLPNGVHWDINSTPTNSKTGWTITGGICGLTVSPSILVTGYHGFLRNGEFTPDIDGNEYDKSGRIINK